MATSSTTPTSAAIAFQIFRPAVTLAQTNPLLTCRCASSCLQPTSPIRLIRPSTQAWIDRLSATEFGGGIGDWRLTWKPGTRDIVWDRVIKSIEGNLVTVDAPITTAIEKQFGGGQIKLLVS